MRVRVTKNRDAYNRLRAYNQSVAVGPDRMGGAVLNMLGKVHRRQQLAIFASEGGTGGGGHWPELSPPYAKKKRKLFPSRKMLMLSGDMKSRFTMPSNPYYHQAFIPRGSSGAGVFRFGAASRIAAAHYHGNPAMAPQPSGISRRIFGGIARQLPVRDMISKTAAHVAELSAAFHSWYAKSYVPSIIRNHDRLIRASRPR